MAWPARKADDPYGRDKPTRVRLPIDARQVREDLNALLERDERAMAREVGKIVGASAEDVPLDELDETLRTGADHEHRWVQRWRSRYASAARDKLAERWFEAQRAGVRSAIGVVGGKVDDRLDFDQLNRRVNNWVRERGADFVTDVTDTQRNALRDLLAHQIARRPASPGDLARVIQPLVGLTPGQATSLAKRADEMLENGSSVAAVAKWTDRRRAEAIKYRAETIARTELAFAHNFGVLNTVREAQAQGRFGAGAVVLKVWYTARDERVCPFCGPLHGQVIGLEETFPGATRKLRSTFAPPAHPRCRCTLFYEVDQAHPVQSPSDDPTEQDEPAAVVPIDVPAWDTLSDEDPVEYGYEDRLTKRDFRQAMRRAEEWLEAGLRVDGRSLLGELQMGTFDDDDAARREFTGRMATLIKVVLGDHEEWSAQSRMTVGRFENRELELASGKRVWFARIADPAAAEAIDREVSRALAFVRRSLPPARARRRLEVKYGIAPGRRRGFCAVVRGEDEVWPSDELMFAVSLPYKSDPARYARLALHECGHVVEKSNGRVWDAARLLHQRRTRGDKVTEIDGEPHLPDKFYDEYAGRLYDDNTGHGPSSRRQEVTTMALQPFFQGPEHVTSFAMKDREHFIFAVAVLRGEFGWRP